MHCANVAGKLMYSISDVETVLWTPRAYWNAPGVHTMPDIGFCCIIHCGWLKMGLGYLKITPIDVFVRGYLLH